MALNETGQPRLVVVYNEHTWEVPLEDIDKLSIGRSEDNTIPLTLGNVSRRHAEVLRKGGIFILRDLGSTNGTWSRTSKVDELILQDGDVFRVGDAQIVFKSGFGEEALTMADAALAKRRDPPAGGLCARLDGLRAVAGQRAHLAQYQDAVQEPGNPALPANPLEPRGIVDEVVIVPNLIKQDQYNRLGDYLVEDLGYERGVDFFEFAYDWRQDVRISARQLGAV